VYVTRIPAPLPSPTSLPQLSHTRMVFRANVPPEIDVCGCGC
jgi:hypothetical protein